MGYHTKGCGENFVGSFSVFCLVNFVKKKGLFALSLSDAFFLPPGRRTSLRGHNTRVRKSDSHGVTSFLDPFNRNHQRKEQAVAATVAPTNAI